VIILREFNLFVIKNEYIDFYKKRPEELFYILEKLSSLKYNLNYGITLFEQLCDKINVDILRNYLNDKYDMNNSRVFYINKILVELKHSRVVVKSKYNYPRILKSFNCYNRNIFVCDFKNNDYFWLSKFVRPEVLEYI